MKNDKVEEHQKQHCNGLEVPPLEEWAFLFAHNSTSLDPSEFFNEIDDNGNVKVNSDSTETWKGKLKTTYKGKGKEMKRLIEVLKPGEAFCLQSIPEKHEEIPSKSKVQIFQNLNNQVDNKKRDVKMKSNISSSIRNKPIVGSDADLIESKIESTKRKLHESYEKIENAKKQRKIQVIDFQPLPKKAACQRIHHPTLKKRTILA